MSNHTIVSVQASSSDDLTSEESPSSLRALNLPPPSIETKGVLLSYRADCFSIVEGNKGQASSLALSDNLLFSGSDIGEIRVWAIPTTHYSNNSEGGDYRCVEVLKLNAGEGAVKDLVVASGDQLLSAHQDQKIRIWRRNSRGKGGDMVHYKLVATLPTVKDYFTSLISPTPSIQDLVVASGDQLLRTHQDQKIRIWRDNRGKGGDMIQYKLVATLPIVKDYFTSLISPTPPIQVRRNHSRQWVEHVDTISALAIYNPRGGGEDCIVYSCSWDRMVKVWRLSDHRCLESFLAHDDAINTMEVSSDGFLYTGSSDKKIKVWCGHRGAIHSLVATLEGHRSAVTSLALNPKGTLLYSAGGDHNIVVWEKEDSAEHMMSAGALKGHRRGVLCLAMSVSGLLCSGSADNTIRVWRREASAGLWHSCVAILKGHNSPIKSLCVYVPGGETTPDLSTLIVYSGCLDGHIKMWRICCAR